MWRIQVNLSYQTFTCFVSSRGACFVVVPCAVLIAWFSEGGGCVGVVSVLVSLRSAVGCPVWLFAFNLSEGLHRNDKSRRYPKVEEEPQD